MPKLGLDCYFTSREENRGAGGIWVRQRTSASTGLRSKQDSSLFFTPPFEPCGVVGRIASNAYRRAVEEKSGSARAYRQRLGRDQESATKITAAPARGRGERASREALRLANGRVATLEPTY